MHTKIALGLWEPPAVVAARRRAEAEAQEALSIGFAEYAEQWMEMIRTQPDLSADLTAAAVIGGTMA